RALEQAELRRDFTFGEHLQRPHDQWQHLGDVARADWPAAAIGPWRAANEVLVGEELVTILLHRHAGELPSTDDDDLAAVLFELLDEGDEVAVAADDDEGVAVVVGEAHLEGVEGHRNVGPVLVAARRELPLEQ